MKEPEFDRWTLIRDSLIFQIKLAMDAVRDLLLSPVSIMCTVLDVFSRRTLSQSYFHKLMRFGQKTDHWLNLFGNHQDTLNSEKCSENKGGKTDLSSITTKAEESVDQLFTQVENLLKDQHGKGGLTASAKSTIDRYLNSIIDKNDKKNK